MLISFITTFKYPKTRSQSKKGVGMKKAQITIFIIIGLLLLITVGIVLYLVQTQTTREFEAARPQIAQTPTFAQPVRDVIDSCISRITTDGLLRIGSSGGYVTSDLLDYNPVFPTAANAVTLSPMGGPPVAYWWYMKSPDTCEGNCLFDSKRVNLYRREGGITIEGQLDDYLNNNIADCVRDISVEDCTASPIGNPDLAVNVGRDDVFVSGSYPIRVTCEQRTVDLRDSYVSLPLNLREIYTLALNITNYQAQQAFLEQATNVIITSYSAVDEEKLPPYSEFLAGEPSASVYWVKYSVLEKLKTLLSTYISLIQVSSTNNYRYIIAPPDVRDKELYEILYNRQFYLPLDEAHPTLDVHFSYLPWWNPYFDLNCNGQLCTADTADAFLSLFAFGMKRYQFAYDLSYPVMVEIRNPRALNGQGYTFRFMLEQNMRDSRAAKAITQPFTLDLGAEPDYFCDPDQRTSPELDLTVIDGHTLQPVDGATVSFTCSAATCTLGRTDTGTFMSSYPACFNGVLRVTKAGYQPLAMPFDSSTSQAGSATLKLQPERTLIASIRNFELIKDSKRGQWYLREGAPSLPNTNQSTTIQLTKQGSAFEDDYVSFVQLEGNEPAPITIVPGKYTVQITSFYNGNITIPKDRRCTKPSKILFITIVGEKCFDVPAEPLEFGTRMPFPYGRTEFDVDITEDMLRGKTAIQFKDIVLAINKVPEGNRILEDMNQMNALTMYGKANEAKLRPVLT